MGVHGLWKLLEAAGKPVPLETLENKVLSVDVSIWLHQMMKGYQDSRGAAVPNAHLLGLFHRVCKLMYYKIKPVFVFDGGVPLLKRQTIAARKHLKKLATQSAADAKEQLLKNLVKRKAVRHILEGTKASSETPVESTSKEDMFLLPPLPVEELSSDSEHEVQDRLEIFMESGESESDSEPDIKPSSQLLHGLKPDLHTIDVHSEEFLSLPPDVRHDILSELKETRKQNSWGRLHEMPDESGEFSNYQLGRLLKRRNVQVSLEKAEKEMGGKVMRMNELQELMTAQGVKIIEENPMINSASQRVASDASTRFVLYKGSTSSNSQNADSSKKENDDEDNTLYNEQVEFIAQMADNMLQKIVKNKEEKSSQDSMSDKEGQLVSVPGDLENKILADNWSSDDENEPNSTSLGPPSASKLEEDPSKTQYFETRKRRLDHSSVVIDSASTQSLSNVCPSNNKSLKLDSSSGPRMQTYQEDVVLEPSSPSCSDREESCDDRNRHEASGSDIGREADQFVPLVNSEKLSKVLSNSERKDSTKPFSPGRNLNDQEQTGTEIKKQCLEIVIHPEENPDGDDIFSDIFQNELKPDAKTKKQKERVEVAAVKKNDPLEIIIQPLKQVDEEDIFADIFQNHKPTETLKPIKVETFSGSESDASETSLSTGSELRKILKTHPSVTDEVIKKELMADDIIDHSDQQKKPSDSTHKDSNTENNLNAVESNSIISSLFSNQPSSSTDWNDMEASLEVENLNLEKERGRQERLAASITDQMCVEAQELLQLFGLPYIVAPMEAEAQCAFLDAISLTEGSITDDSDIWLFGGKKVYKNFFNQKKHVLQFTSSNIKHYFKLSREQLVQLALLVGSDYTTGIQGIGPVTALEIVAAFQCRMESDPVQSAIKGLGQFKDWWNSGRPHKSNRMRLLDKKLKNVKFAEGFPSRAVVEAYLRPSVENSEETFSWGALDLPALREYARTKFGWPVSKTDEILLPVSKRWSSRSSQRAIDSYFNFQPHLVEGLNKMSKRVQKAVTLMEADADSDNVDDPEPIAKSSTNQRKQKGRKTAAPREKKDKIQRNKRTVLSSSDSETDHGVSSEVAVPRDKTNKRQRSRRTAPVSPDGESDPEVSSVVAAPREKKSEKERSKRTAPFSSDCESDHEVSTVKKKVHSEGSQEVKELPVRAPTVPRERSAVGVKRIGRISSKTEESCQVIASLKTVVERTKQSTNTRPTESATEQACYNNRSETKGSAKQSKTTKAKSEDRAEFSDEVLTDMCKNSSATREKYANTGKNSRSSRSSKGNTCSEDVNDSLDPQPSTSFAESVPEPVRETSRDIIDEWAMSPSEEAALAEMNWEDDPWDAGEGETVPAEKHRPKVFFGGIRPNRPKKPVRTRAPIPVEANDTRGVQPGWMTRERLESRTAWVDSMAHQKKTESIPQRERDQKAMEEAKMKAIAVVKASDSRHASLLLGKPTSKRGRGKAKPIRKILPEHNLSESSSDE